MSGNAVFRAVFCVLLCASGLNGQGGNGSGKTLETWQASGTLVEADGPNLKPIPNIRLGIRPKGKQQSATLTTGGDGTFAFSNLVAGSYDLIVPNPYKDGKGCVTENQRDFGQIRLENKNQSEGSGLDSRKWTAKGSLTDGENPIGQLDFSITRADNRKTPKKTDQRGEFTLEDSVEGLYDLDAGSTYQQPITGCLTENQHDFGQIWLDLAKPRVTDSKGSKTPPTTATPHKKTITLMPTPGSASGMWKITGALLVLTMLVQITSLFWNRAASLQTLREWQQTVARPFQELDDIIRAAQLRRKQDSSRVESTVASIAASNETQMSESRETTQTQGVTSETSWLAKAAYEEAQGGVVADYNKSRTSFERETEIRRFMERYSGTEVSLINQDEINRNSAARPEFQKTSRGIFVAVQNEGQWQLIPSFSKDLSNEVFRNAFTMPSDPKLLVQAATLSLKGELFTLIEKGALS